MELIEAFKKFQNYSYYYRNDYFNQRCRLIAVYLWIGIDFYNDEFWLLLNSMHGNTNEYDHYWVPNVFVEVFLFKQW